MQSTRDYEAILPVPVDSPFDLNNDAAYRWWRQTRLALATPSLADLLVEVEDPFRLDEAEKSSIVDRCQQYNMAVYALKDSEIQQKSLVHALGKQLNMSRLDSNLRADEDSVTSLEVRSQSGNQYIPYTNKALSWHTDGYYNRLDKQIYGIIMHCVSPAAEGGVNRLLNPEALYIALRDEDPAFIEALMHPEAMTIPENIESGEVVRDAQSGPVFMLKPVQTEGSTMRLHMRYSARKRNIIWRDTDATHQAVAFINRYLADDDRVSTVALSAGQGIVCNNVLHNRTGFVDSDGQKRLMYRARYYDAVCE